MIGTIIILAIVCFILFLSSYYSEKPLSFIERNDMKESTEKLLKNVLLEEIKKMRIYEKGGNGIKPVSLYKEIYKANKIIVKKVEKSIPLTEAEKWIYENFYLCYRYVFGNFNDMRDLPHINNEPRIIKIARIIVNNSLNTLDPERIKGVLGEISGSISFTYREILGFNDAIAYSILEQIYILCERINYQNKCKNKAEKGLIAKTNVTKDVYLYYLIKSKKYGEKQRELLKRIGIEEKDVCLNFNYVSLKNTQMAETLFGALREIGKFLPINIGIKFLGAYNVLNSISDLGKINDDTLCSYFSIIEKISKNVDVSEKYVSEKLKEISLHNDIDISYILYDNYRDLKKAVKNNSVFKYHKNKNLTEIIFYALISICTLLLSILIAFLTKSILFTLLLIIPLFIISDHLVIFLFSHTESTFKTPSMNYKNIRFEDTTMVVISEFIGSIEQLKQCLFHAETIFEGNNDENLFVTVLIDTKGGDMPVSDLDNEIIGFLSGYNYSDHINFFVRKKTFCEDQFIPKERKRGAIMSLCKTLITHNEFDFLYIKNSDYVTPKYILTLDADNTLLPGEILKCVNMMAHPYNLTYEILSLQCRNNLFSLKNIYSLKYYRESGFENYPNYSGIFSKLFKTDIYCGKGIIRLSDFYNKIEEVFPSKKILSHDIIEGSLLKTGSGGMCFEDAPQNFISDRERHKRWQRGDIQLLPFIFGLWKDDSGRRLYKKVCPLGRYVILKNILSILYPPVLFSILLSGLILSKELFLIGSAIFIFPYVLSEIRILRGLGYSKSILSIFESTVQNIISMFEDFFTFGYYAVDNTVIFISTIIKMIFKKNLLKWKTYYSSQKEKKLIDYAQIFSLSTFILTLIGLILTFTGFFTLYFSIYIFASISFYLIVYLSEKIEVYKKNKKNEDSEFLTEIAKRIYNYFTFMRENDGLISDNYQVKPYKGKADYTSPTNIAFSILAEISAFYFDFISLEECVYNLDNIISVINSLDKWHGLLFNWYDVTNKKPKNEFVSSVDNGNLLASFIIADEFLKKKGEKLTSLKFELIIKDFDISKLYDRQKKLFFIGFDGKEFLGHYDLLASESRILSFIYISFYNDYEHYFALKKDFSGDSENVLLSWSGTMFEMLMAEMFFPTPFGSVLYDSAKKTVKIQSSVKNNGLWGVSESAYSEFDSDMKYQYSAFGIKRLALDDEIKEDVISAYSSLLCLRYDSKKVINNIKNYINKSGLNEYGLYESIDFTSKMKIVYSYMTHHQGMILCSIVNYLFDDIFRNLIISSPKIYSVLNYFNEIKSNVKNIRKRLVIGKKYTQTTENYYKYFDKIDEYYISALLTNTDYSIICNSIGSNTSSIFNNNIFKNSNAFEEDNGLFFFGKDENNALYSPTYLPLFNNEKYTFSYSGNEVNYSSKKISESITVFPMLNGEIRKLVFDKTIRNIFSYGDICLCNKDDYVSHPAFQDIFLKVQKISDDTICFEKKVPGKSRDDFFMAVKIIGLTDIVWECNKMNYLGEGRSIQNADFLYQNNNKKFFPSIGNVLFPCIGFRGNTKKDKNECQIILLYGENKKMLFDTIFALPNDSYKFAKGNGESYYVKELTQSILGGLLFGTYSSSYLKKFVYNNKKEIIRKYFFDAKIIRYVFSGKNLENLIKVFETISELKIIGLNIILEIECDEKTITNYSRIIEKTAIIKKVDNYCFFNGTSDDNFKPIIIINEDLSVENLPFNEDIAYKIRKEKKIVFSNNYVDMDLIFKTGCGGFDQSGDYIVNKLTLLPYSNVIGGKSGGIISTNFGNGFYYFGNSRENKAVRFENDVSSNICGECFYIKNSDGFFDLNSNIGKNGVVIIGKGKTTRKISCDAFDLSLTEQIVLNGKLKVSDIDIFKKSNENFSFIYYFYPSLNWKYEPKNCIHIREGSLITIINLRSGKKIYTKIIGISDENLVIEDEGNYLPEYEYAVDNSEHFSIVSGEDLSLVNSITPDNLTYGEIKSSEYFNGLSAIDIVTEEKSFDHLINFLPYQIISSRLNAKSGFYQVGGATGFRDQLQDALAFSFEPDILKERIIDACEHQYEAGDVMHWWHEKKFGLRTRISDDKLFLPYAVCKYIEYTQNYDFLQEEYVYLHSEPLRYNEKDRFEDPSYTNYKETVFKHCLKAIRSSLKYGEHNLLVMGNGDWNDGMDKICAMGEGESVFNSMLCHLVLKEFAELCPDDLKEEMYKISSELKNNINIYAFDEDRYMRLYSDDGRWLGSSKSGTLKLDLLTQAFAVISGVADGERAKICLETAKQLIDKKAGIIKLLYPPQTRKDYLGYISDYPEGIRENGGQYTHAAIWYLIALVTIGKKDEAFDLFQMINPVEKCKNVDMNITYKTEPYVLSGDVYSNNDNYGRGGWSWYTGSAGWAYKLAVEYFFGLRRRGDHLYIEPSLPKKLFGSTVVYRYKNSSYIFEYKSGLVNRLTLNGKIIDKIKLEDNVREKIIVETDSLC